MQKMIRVGKFALVAVVVFSLAGCGGGGPELVPVKGVVKVDGKPAKGVVLTFVKEGGGMNQIPASAVSEEGGAFTLITGEKGGAEVGKYKVSAIYPDPNAKAPSLSQQMQGYSAFDAPDVFKGKYAGGKTTVVVEVKKGVAELGPIELSQ